MGRNSSVKNSSLRIMAFACAQQRFGFTPVRNDVAPISREATAPCSPGRKPRVLRNHHEITAKRRQQIRPIPISRCLFTAAVAMVACLSLTLAGEIAHGAMHPDHVSLTEIEVNPKTGNLEVSLRVWPEDLEKLLTKLNGEPVELNSKTLKELMPDYLKEKFIVRSFAEPPSKQKTLPIRWVGAEVEVASAWLYFEVQTAGSKSDWEIDNKIFCDLNDDQLNYVSVRRRNLRSHDSILRCQSTSKSDPNRINFPEHHDQ